MIVSMSKTKFRTSNCRCNVRQLSDLICNSVTIFLKKVPWKKKLDKSIMENLHGLNSSTTFGIFVTSQRKKSLHLSENKKDDALNSAEGKDSENLLLALMVEFGVKPNLPKHVLLVQSCCYE